MGDLEEGQRKKCAKSRSLGKVAQTVPPLLSSLRDEAAIFWDE